MLNAVVDTVPEMSVTQLPEATLDQFIKEQDVGVK